MTPKPIILIYYLPDALVIGDSKMPNIREVNEMFQRLFPDYNVLAFPSYQSADGSCEDVRLQVFYEKDFTQIQYEYLKQLIFNSIENIKQCHQ